MKRAIRRAVAAVCVLPWLLAGCAGGSEPKPLTQEEAAQATAIPEALSDFRCDPVEDGTYSASGTVANTGDEPVDVTVTVYVGPADGQPRPASSTTLGGVKAGESSRFDLTGIPVGGDPADCHVQVLRLP